MKGEYISIDTTKKIAELEKEIERLNNIIKELEKDNCRLSYSDEVLNNIIIEKDKEIERLNNKVEELDTKWINSLQQEEEYEEWGRELKEIINEAREYIEKNIVDYITNYDDLKENILAILDKGEIK